eukprot:5788398-Amphidinium_carterae.1
MQIIENSTLFVHANDYSCKLPRHHEVTSKESLALIGNHFAKPRQLPPWITTAEQPSDMFCVSESQGKNFGKIFLGCACIFSFASAALGLIARAKSAWNETSQYQSSILMASCVPALLYNSMQSLACSLTADHLRYRLVATRPREAVFVVCLHTGILKLAARFYWRHVTWGQPAKKTSARTRPTRWQRFVPLTSSSVHTFWLCACVLTSAPGVFYSTVKAVGQTEALQHITA